VTQGFTLGYDGAAPSGLRPTSFSAAVLGSGCDFELAFAFVAKALPLRNKKQIPCGNDKRKTNKKGKSRLNLFCEDRLNTPIEIVVLLVVDV
jgi:hypothetical protein